MPIVTGTGADFDSVERYLATELDDRLCFGEVLVRRNGGNGFVLCHADEDKNKNLEVMEPKAAIEIARYDDAGNYRPLKTAPTLRHGWQIEVATLSELRRVLDYFYPARLAAFVAWKRNILTTTSLRDTLIRQSGMYRIAAKISDQQINDVVGDFCRSDGGCLRTILWRRDKRGTISSTKLPPEKFDTASDQGGRGEHAVPLLCQEACNLLVNECRKMVKGEE